MLAQSMRPDWKADTYSIPTPDGIYLRGNNNRLILKGKSLYPLLKHLVPYLNGNTTLEEITHGLDADHARMVTNLLEKLLSHRFLSDASQDQPHTLLPSELEACAPNIAFIKSFQPSAAYRFEAFRNYRLLVIASGLDCSFLVRTYLQAGGKNISVIDARENQVASFSRQAALDSLTDSGSEANLRLLAAPSWNNEAEVQALVQEYDAIVHVAEQSKLARAQLLNRLCVAQEKLCLQAIIGEREAWLGPLVCPQSTACWECMWRRLQATLASFSDQPAPDAFLAQPPTTTDRFLTGTGAALIASRLLFALFRHVTQASADETAGKVEVLDLETYVSESRAFLPHPHCLACQRPEAQTAAQFLEQLQDLRSQGPVDPHVLLEHFAECVDQRFGLFTMIEDGRFVQVPLAVYKVHFSHPTPGKSQEATQAVVAASIDAGEARLRVAQLACERYAAAVVDPRRLLSPEKAGEHTFPVVLPADVLAPTTPASAEEQWIWALDLRTQQPSRVPATHVFSSLCGHERGLGAGYTWEEALCRALMDWCNYLTVAQVQKARRSYPLVDLERVPMTPQGLHLYRLLQAADAHITAYDITGPLRVPTFAFCVGKNVVAYCTHCDCAEALRLGFEQALRQCQSVQSQDVDYALAPVAEFPLHLRDDRWSMPHYSSPENWAVRQEWLLQQLQGSAFQAYAVPLNHDPALARISPFIVRVLLSGKELGEGE